MVVVIDVRIGEVFVFVSVFDYDFNNFIFCFIFDVVVEMIESKVWMNCVIGGVYLFGFMFKIFIFIVGFCSGYIDFINVYVECIGIYMVGNKVFVCNNYNVFCGMIMFLMVIERSCNMFFYDYGLKVGFDGFVVEVCCFYFDCCIGIELFYEIGCMFVFIIEWM